MNNAQYRQSGSPEKRKGYQGHAAHVGGFGQWTYQRVNPTTGVLEPEVIKIDQNLWKGLETQIEIDYTGLATSAEISIFLDPTTSTYKCEIQEGAIVVLSVNLGTGIDEVSPYTATQLNTAINALTNFTATLTGAGTTPAAFFKIVRAWDLVAMGNLTLEAFYFSQVNTPLTNPFSTYYSHKSDADFENVSAVQIQNCMYFGSGYEDIYKYDGQTFYRAGLPEPASVTSAIAAGPGAITGSNYFHRAQYIQYDNAGNIIEGNIASTATGLNPAAQNMDVTVANILAATGFNTNCAIVNGAQVAVNLITVDNGSGGNHTMKVGDTAYFFDAVSGTYVTRAVTATGLTTITVAGAAVTVADNAVISNNLRIEIWRNKTSAITPSVFYLVEEIPNNSFAATQVYTDSKTDSNLGAQLIPPATDRSVPPRGKYISQWNGIAMLAGNLLNPLILYYSDVDGPEYFPADSNQLLIESGAQDIISGIAPNNEVFTVHGQSSFTVVSGDILTGQLRIETKSRDTGCVAHATLAEVDGLLCWLSSRGPRYSTGGQVPLPLGASVDANRQESASRIDPEFDNLGRPSQEQYVFKRALGYSDLLTGWYLLYVPTETSFGSDISPNDNSRVFTYDKNRDAWLIWSNLNLQGGISQLNRELFFSERRYSNFTGSLQSYMYRRHNLEDAWDYADNTEAISWEYDSQWDPLNEPSVLKKYLKLRIFALEEITNNEFTLTIEQETNYQKEVAKATFTMSIPGGGYGITPYGTTAYGDPGQGEDTHPLHRDRIYSTRFRFKNSTIHENVVMTGWEIEAVTPYRAEFKA